MKRKVNRNKKSPLLACIATDTPPLSCWADGSVRVGNSRVPMERIVYAYRTGETPEEINQDFSSLELSDIYGALAFYFRHKDMLDAYIQARETDAANQRRKHEARFPAESIRERLLARKQTTSRSFHRAAGCSVGASH